MPQRPLALAATSAALSAVLATSLLAACSGGGATSVSGTRTTPTTPTSPAAESPGLPAADEPVDATAQPPSTITLAFGGDVHFANQLAARLDDPQAALAELRPYLATADLTMVNLETAITT
ncbi:MAG: CapA family protein, partial [Angustibacter sp.]